MNILALDTSSDALVLGLQKDDERLEVSELLERSHSREILPTMTNLLADAGLSLNELDLLVYGQGPGSFTGIRITVGVVQGLAYGLNLPVAPVSSLACLAQGEYRRTGNEHIVVALSARKQEVFFGAYEIADGIARLVGRETVADVRDAPSPGGRERWVGVGSGWQFRDELTTSLGITMDDVRLEAYPSGIDLLDLGQDRHRRGELISASEATPEYLREQVATPRLEK